MFVNSSQGPCSTKMSDLVFAMAMKVLYLPADCFSSLIFLLQLLTIWRLFASPIYGLSQVTGRWLFNLLPKQPRSCLLLLNLLHRELFAACCPLLFGCFVLIWVNHFTFPCVWLYPMCCRARCFWVLSHSVAVGFFRNRLMKWQWISEEILFAFFFKSFVLCWWSGNWSTLYYHVYLRLLLCWCQYKLYYGR